MFGSYVGAYACPCVISTEDSHREKDRPITDFAGTASNEILGVDLDFDDEPNEFVEGAIRNKDPKYWSAVLDTIKEEEERRAAKRAELNSHTLGNFKERAKAYVHKLLSRKEWKDDSKALEAVQKEGAALIEAGTWLMDSVVEKDQLIHKAQKDGKKIHMADLLSTCTIKHWEVPELRRYKGRICYRGDDTRDEYGAAAIHQDLSSSPTTIQGANANIAFGAAPGNGTSAADAVRAYVHGNPIRTMARGWQLERHAPTPVSFD